jgi:hypothetical protein
MSLSITTCLVVDMSKFAVAVRGARYLHKKQIAILRAK